MTRCVRVAHHARLGREDDDLVEWRQLLEQEVDAGPLLEAPPGGQLGTEHNNQVTDSDRPGSRQNRGRSEPTQAAAQVKGHRDSDPPTTPGAAERRSAPEPACTAAGSTAPSAGREAASDSSVQ